jgi:hypothetical protein
VERGVGGARGSGRGFGAAGIVPKADNLEIRRALSGALGIRFIYCKGDPRTEEVSLRPCRGDPKWIYKHEKYIIQAEYIKGNLPCRGDPKR